MVNINSSRTCLKARFEGRLYIVYGTSTVPSTQSLTIFPTLGKHRLDKFSTQGREFYVGSATCASHASHASQSASHASHAKGKN